MINKNFYPTPPPLISRMMEKIKHTPSRMLEPHGGKGDIAEAIEDRYRSRFGGNLDVSVIEIDLELQATLIGKGYKLVDQDFLTYSGPDQFDLIIANPPFDNGDKHLLKAIDIMYRGEIVFLLNSETIRNPHSASRQLLARKLEELGAEIEHIKDAFIDAERRTPVEVALVYIDIKRELEQDIFDGVADSGDTVVDDIHDKHELATGKTVEELVLSYNEVVRLSTETIMAYYQNFNKVRNYVEICNTGDRDGTYSGADLTARVQYNVNKMLSGARKDYWRQVLNIDEVKKRMTEKKRKEFEDQLSTRSHMDFTEANIRSFVLNLVGSYEQTLTEATIDIFDLMTRRHSFQDGDVHEKNVLHFNGWKTNKAFKVGKRVVIPVSCSYGNPFMGYSGLTLDYKARAMLDDIDTVMNYFDGMTKYLSIADALKASFADGEMKAESEYFKIIAYKKGTIHLTFKNLDVLRRFNVTACKGKGWLPGDYGAKGYALLPLSESATVDAFEGAKEYAKNVGEPVFKMKELKLLC